MTTSRDLSDADALALMRQTGAGWDITYFPRTPRHPHDPPWYSASLRCDVYGPDDETFYFTGFAPTLGRAVLKAMIRATRWALTGEYRR